MEGRTRGRKGREINKVEREGGKRKGGKGKEEKEEEWKK